MAQTMRMTLYRGGLILALAALAINSTPVTVRGATYYLAGNTWFKPMFGANGVYYQVVPAPRRATQQGLGPGHCGALSMVPAKAFI